MAPTESEEGMKNKKCCICGGKVEGMGRNPWPIENREGAVCCDWCDSTVVWVARLRMFINEENEKEQ